MAGTYHLCKYISPKLYSLVCKNGGYWELEDGFDINDMKQAMLCKHVPPVFSDDVR